MVFINFNISENINKKQKFLLNRNSLLLTKSLLEIEQFNLNSINYLPFKYKFD